MYRIKLRFCLDRDDDPDNDKIIDGMFRLLTVNNEKDMHFIHRDDHELLSRLVRGLSHVEFIEVNGDAFRDKLRKNIMGCDRLSEEQRTSFLEVIDLMEEVGRDEPVADARIPTLFQKAKLK